MLHAYRTKGFTLIELLVVIAIIGLLSTIILAPIQNARKKARDAKRTAEMDALVTGLVVYFDDNGTYPVAALNTDTGWRTSCSAATGAGLTGTVNLNQSPVIPSVPVSFIPAYVSKMPTDPLNAAGTGTNYCYAYRSNGAEYKIVLYNITEATAVPANVVDTAIATSTVTRCATCQGTTACAWQ